VGIILNALTYDKYAEIDYKTADQVMEALEKYAKEMESRKPNITDSDFDYIVPDHLDEPVMILMVNSGRWKRHKNGFSLKQKYLQEK
jgi:hypothetical protein